MTLPHGKLIAARDGSAWLLDSGGGVARTRERTFEELHAEFSRKQLNEMCKPCLKISNS
jgi:hypothetical protein